MPWLICWPRKKQIKN